MLNGKKTYITGALSIVGALVGACFGQLSVPEAFQIIETAVLAMTVRHGIATK